MTSVKYLIIGAGPTGLGAANRLRELGEDSFLVLEKNPYPGGLAASFKDGSGFTWDTGGHVIFSHYEYFDRLLERLLGDDYLEHRRKAYIRAAETWVPYPFQNNIRHLPPKKQWECVQGLLELNGAPPPTTFREWIMRTFGQGIAEIFMLPYNAKVWATPLELMDFTWIAERVSLVDVQQVIKNIIYSQDEVSWGPNSRFKFPLVGGTGEIFSRLAARVGGRVLTDSGLARVNTETRTAETTDGRVFSFERLLNTMPLDRLVLDVVENLPGQVRDFAARLKHNGVHVAGVGLEGRNGDDKCWMYFPENSCPFYRVTNFHIYSPHNTPKPWRQRALMTETAYSGYRPANGGKIMDQTIQGLCKSSLMSRKDIDNIVSAWEKSFDYAYPIPCLDRDRALSVIIPELEKRGIWSRGRFGGWKYEVGNMDHSVMQGVEWAELMTSGNKEKTYTV